MKHLEIDPIIKQTEIRKTMIKEKETVEEILKKEAKWLVGFGLINITFDGFNSPFGIILILLGLAAYRSSSAAIFVVQAVVFLAAGISNLFIGGVASIFFTIVLFVSVVALFKQYRDYRYQGSKDTGHNYLWIGLALGILAILGVAGFFLSSMVFMLVNGTDQVPVALSFFMVLCSELGTVVLGLGIASVLEGYRPKIVSWFVLSLGLFSFGFQVFVMLAT